jgi:dTDP-4-amino-4,6-dideoxygalactose transaminase
MIPMLDIKRELADIGSDINKAVQESIKNTQFILGPNVKELEKAAAEYLGCKYTLGVASGTDALHLALRALGIQEGDEVITTPFTFIATAEAIAYCGATPVFVDVEEDTMNIDPTKIEEKITDKTKAILPVHIFGNPANMDAILDIAKKHSLKVIEDCAQSFGATWNDKQTGSMGDAGCFSFFPSKNLGCYGDGGLISTNCDDTYNELIALRNHGMYTRYYHDKIGYNSRLDDIQAAILNVKLGHIDRFNSERIRVADGYIKTIGDRVTFQSRTTSGTHIYHQFTFKTDRRDEIMKELSNHEIASAIYYPIPLHLQKAFADAGFQKGDCPISEALSESVMSLPINPYLEDEEVIVISELINGVIDS